MEKKAYIVQLFNRYITNQASMAEVEELFTYIRVNREDDFVAKLIEQSMFEAPELANDLDRERRLAATHQTLLQHISQQAEPVRPKVIPLWKIAAVAASLLLISMVTLYFIRTNKGIKNSPAMVIKAEEVAPGTNTAILTLGNGQKVNLSAVNDGSLGQEANVAINKQGDQLTYTANSQSAANAAINTVQTPNGGQYQLTLADGTKVWLNAASKISYPVALLTNGQRVVTLNGEAYFEVAKDRAHPFIVKSNGQEVKVLGTHFNVSSYADDRRTVTTLEEGSVSVSANGKQTLLSPGQQAINHNANLSVQQADLNAALAWKRGLFYFQEADVKTIMPQLARWYDIDIVYNGELANQRITGDISRHTNLATVLRIMELAHLQFRVEMRNGRKTLLVSPLNQIHTNVSP